MELRHLRYFVAIAEESSVGRAARRLNVAQPALSRQIQDLERDVGVRLFERLPRGLTLTEAGRAFLLEAQAALEHSDRAKQTAQRFASGQAGRIVVGYVETATLGGLLPSALRLHAARHPGVLLELRRLTTVQQWSAIRSHEIDVGFVHGRPQDTEGLAFAPARDEPYTGVLLPAAHRLARRRELVAVELSGEPMMLFPRSANPQVYERVLAALRALGLDAPVALEVPDGSGIFAFVAQRTGWHVVPASARELLPQGVVFRPVRGLAIPCSIELMWREERSAAATYFVEAVAAVRARVGCAAPAGSVSIVAASLRR